METFYWVVVGVLVGMFVSQLLWMYIGQNPLRLVVCMLSSTPMSFVENQAVGIANYLIKTFTSQTYQEKLDTIIAIGWFMNVDEVGRKHRDAALAEAGIEWEEVSDGGS